MATFFDASTHEKGRVIRKEVCTNIESLLKKGGYERTLLKSSHLRSFELKCCQLLLEEYAQLKKAIWLEQVDIKSIIKSVPANILSMEMCDIFHIVGNPSTTQDLFKRMSELDTETENENCEAPAVDTDFPVTVHDCSWETAGTGEGSNTNCTPNTNQNAVPPNNLPTTPVKSDSSAEIFQTPMTHTVYRPTKTIHPHKNEIPQFPKHGEKAVVAVPRPSIFVFGGKKNKEPRVVRPGEVLFSVTGSPVDALSYSTRPASVLDGGNTTPETLLHNGRPIHIRVDNPTGPGGIEVAMTLQGDYGGAESSEVFRKFVTDVRGFVTTRSVLASRVLPPRVPCASSHTGYKRTRKPAWKN